MKLHEYLEKHGTSKTQFAINVDMSRSQISDICNDGFANNNKRIVPLPDNVTDIHRWTSGEVTYSDWYT